MDWIQLLINLVMTGILLYVFQRVIDERSAKRLEKFKAELQSTAFEKETKFSKLHEIRSAIIAELYKKLFHLREALSSVTLFLEDPDWYIDTIVNEKLGNANEAEKEFRVYFQANRLYIPDSICNQIDSIYNQSVEVTNTLWKVSLALKLVEVSKEDAQEYFNEHKEGFLQASSIISDQIDPLLKQLEGEFRNLLGS